MVPGQAEIQEEGEEEVRTWPKMLPRTRFYFRKMLKMKKRMLKNTLSSLRRGSCQ